MFIIKVASYRLALDFTENVCRLKCSAYVALNLHLIVMNSFLWPALYLLPLNSLSMNLLRGILRKSN